MENAEEKCILVVEDEPDVQLYLQTVLEEAGFQVMTADNGKQALDRIKERRPDLISLDLEMPKMRGVKLLEYLQRNPSWSAIPFIIVTSHMRDEIGKRDVEELKAKKILIGPHVFMEKPIVPEDYVTRIRQALHMSDIVEMPAEGSDELRTKVLEQLSTAGEDQLKKILKFLKKGSP
jgi:CheY-like chemotaxis protein